MIRIVRQGDVRATRERWILRGLIKIITHPLPVEREGTSPPEAEAPRAAAGTRRRTRAQKRALPSGS